ncbi:hypothetical protein BJF78_24625 [Pseudonocardia sp. CNS-139]|nr:hypothetical protein BJF78_24625 [Pseudonocardia sp. CNS-139]
MGSRAQPSSTHRSDAVFPAPGSEPISMFDSISGSPTGRPRWSVPNGSTPNTSAVPALRSGHAGGLTLLSGWSPTQSTSRPACCSAEGSGQTADSGRRSPDASRSRRSATSATVTP